MTTEMAPPSSNHHSNGRRFEPHHTTGFQRSWTRTHDTTATSPLPRPPRHVKTLCDSETIFFKRDNTRLSFGARAAGVHYRLFSVWTLVPVRLGTQLSGNSTVDEIASEATDCRLIYTMANCPQRRLEKPEEKEGEREKEKMELEKTRAGRFRKRRGESRSFLFRDADQES
ncbi:hypothetical protein TNCV_516481 [Trichonephila clavipes]|nr:hypothetical protein TNCV_516481 [Trichonephila clavipes]